MQKDHSRRIWLDGTYLPWKKAAVHVLTHALHYGSAVFEGIRFYKTPRGSRVFRLNDHLVRFFDSAKTLGLAIPYSRKELRNVILRLVRESGMDNGYIRPLAFFGSSTLSINPVDVPTRVMVAVFPWLRDGKPIRVMRSSFIRIHPQSTRVEAKIAGHYVNSILALQEARAKGFDEVVLMDSDGYVAEGAVANIFIVKNGKIYTPKTGGILPGITRSTIFELCKRIVRIPVCEKKLSFSDIIHADEVFYVGTAYEVTPVIQCGNKKFNDTPDSITRRIQTIYKQLVIGGIPRYEKWLT